MKENRLSAPKKRLKGILLICAIVTVIITIIAVMMGYHGLVELYTEQCVIKDLERQIHISGGRMIKNDVVADVFGLRVGVNLAKLDLKKAREYVLDKIPNIRALTVARRGLGELDIVIEERTPLAKLNLPRKRDNSGRVTDVEGVVFGCQRGTHQLITIREKHPSAIGSRLSGRMLAAVRLASVVNDPEFASLGVLDIDTSATDYITMTLGDYSLVKIAWPDMDSPTADEPEAMRKQLRHLVQAIRSKIVDGTTLWNATQPNTIYADPTKGNQYNR